MRQVGLILAAGRVRSKKKTKKNAKIPPHKIHHEIYSSAATTTTHPETAREETRPRVSPYSPASIEPGFVEIGLV